MHLAMAGTPYSIPEEPGRWRAITLAVIMHAALIAALWLGIRWQSQTPVAVEAEVWNMETREAAPRAAPLPEPKPEPEVKPVLKVEKELPVQKPDIAIEHEKKRKEKEARLEEERLAKEKAEKAEKAKAAALAKKKEEARKKREQEAKDAELAEKFREEEMKRLMGGTGGAGEAPKSQGLRGDPSYAAKIRQKIRSNTAFVVPGNLQGNPAVEYEVQLFPDGSLKGPPRKKKSSGLAGFDEAVLRAIDLSVPFPPDKSGKVPPSLIIIHQPKDINP